MLLSLRGTTLDGENLAPQWGAQATVIPRVYGTWVHAGFLSAPVGCRFLGVGLPSMCPAVFGDFIESACYELRSKVPVLIRSVQKLVGWLHFGNRFFGKASYI